MTQAAHNSPNYLLLPKMSQDGPNWLSIVQDSSNGTFAQNVGIAEMSKDINENETWPQVRQKFE